MVQPVQELLTSQFLSGVNMGQEFTIKSNTIEDKINQLLPSQGGFGAGVDFSASTMVVPIVDLTESAEGSVLRQDLQKAFSHGSITSFKVAGATTTLITTTGYFRCFGSYNTHIKAAGVDAGFALSDGTTTKNVITFDSTNSGDTDQLFFLYDFIVFLAAGDSFIANSDTSDAVLSGSTRQIADISGNLVNPI